MSGPNPNRREMLRRSLGVAAGTLLLGDRAEGEVGAKPSTSRSPTRALRIAHLTDAHIQPERGAVDGTRLAFRHAQEKFAPDLIIAGGDQIMDALEHPADRVAALYELWHQVVKEECKTPIKYVIGNHDIWGWADPKRSGTTGNEPLYGKAWPLKEFGLEKPYYSWDQAGWHLIVLDSVQFDGGGSYVAMLDEDQFKWLEADLAAVDPKTPIVLFSHIPILGICPLLFDEKAPTTQAKFPKPKWGLSRALMHVDARRIKDLFSKHPNVKLCVSGHIHLTDEVEYLGVTYICNPAVSAGWWVGPMQEFGNGYTVIDLFDDATFTHQSVDYGWVARPKA